MQVRKSSRKKTKLRMGIAAPSGAGKTLSALCMAYGITKDWDKIGLIDTEAGSGEKYTGVVKDVGERSEPIKIEEFCYLRIEPEFTVNKYVSALNAMHEAGVECCIIDSTSHAWAGAGGLLDKQGRIAAKSGNSYTAWRDVTPDHNMLVDAMLQSPMHIIATMRSKQDYVLETNDKGKQVPKKVGMAPVQREGLEYEFDVMLDIDMNHVATASKDRTGIFDGQYFKIGPDTGKRLLEWLDMGIEDPVIKMKAVAEQINKDIAASKTLDQLDKIIPKYKESIDAMPEVWRTKLMDKIADRGEYLSVNGQPATGAA